MTSRISIFTICLAALSVSVLAEEKPPMDIAVYPKSETLLEVNMTSDELFPMIDAMYPMIAARLGAAAQSIAPKDVVAALDGLKRIEVLQMQIDAKDATGQQITDFYTKKLPKGDWSRVMWQCSDSRGTVGVYATQGFENLYGFRITKKVVDDKPVHEVMVAKIEGKVDVAKLATLAGKILGQKIP